MEENNFKEENELTTYDYISNGYYYEYFVGFEVAALIGYSNTSQAVLKNVSKCNQLIFNDYPGVKEPKLEPRTILITRDGAIEILIKTRKRISPDVLYILKKFNIDTTNRKCLSKEQQTLSAITNIFKTEKFEDQYKIGKYYLDLYFPEYGIVVECDENGHVDRKPENERERMDFVNKKLKINDSFWIRFNPDEHDFDMSKVIGLIYIKISSIKENIFNNSLENNQERKLKPRPVLQIDKKTKKIINKFDSIEDACEKTHIGYDGISRCCRRKNITSGGFIWMFQNKEDNIEPAKKYSSTEIIKKEEHNLIFIDNNRTNKKKCTKCLLLLPLSKFYINDNSIDIKNFNIENEEENEKYKTQKYRSSCKKCCNIDSIAIKKRLTEDPNYGKKVCNTCKIFMDIKLFYKKKNGDLFENCSECYNKENFLSNEKRQQCIDCKLILEANNFGIHHGNSLRNQCKTCRNKKLKEQRKNPIKCEFCNKEILYKSSLASHQKSVECLKIQGIRVDKKERKLQTFNIRSKKIVQIDINTKKIINTFISIADAVEKTNFGRTGISKCCRKENKTSGGFAWMYHEDFVKNLY